MKKIITFALLLSCLTTQQTVHAYYFGPDELGGGNPALQEAMGNDPKTILLVLCCPIYTCFGIELLIKAAKNAPSCDQMRTAITSYDCCKRIERARNEFVKSHDNGLISVLTAQPKQIKMKDE